MHIIKLNAIDSTNTYLKTLSITEALKDCTVVVAKHQTNGKGQMGAEWMSEISKNLMCSVFKDTSSVSVEQQFYISIVTSLALIKALEKLQIPKLHIKWPNDILSENKKISGILIENVIKVNMLEASIIGIGLNVNQVEFKGLPNASSLKNITGKVYDLDELLQYIIEYLNHYFLYLEKGELQFLKTEYENYLFRKDKPSTFKCNKGTVFSGFIKGVNETGSLKILLEDNILKEYVLKEIQLLY